MPLPNAKLEHILSQALIVAARASPGGVIVVADVVDDLLQNHPETGLSAEEVEGMLVEFAKRSGMPLKFGATADPQTAERLTA